MTSLHTRSHRFSPAHRSRDRRSDGGPGRPRRLAASRGRSVVLVLAALATSLIAPVAAAAAGPTQIAFDQVTASTVADLWFPIVEDRDVPPSCGATPPIECPGGVPRASSTNLRFTRASLAATLNPPSSFVISADLRVETVDPLAVTVSGVECSLTIDTSAGTSSTIGVRTRADLMSSPYLDYNFILQSNPEVYGLEAVDVTFSGGILCGAFNGVVSLSLDVVQEQLADMIGSHGPLCGVPAPELVATCPWFTVAPSSVDFGDQAVGSSSSPQLITITNAGPGYPYVFDIGQVTVEGPDAADFAISADGCSNAALLSGGCTLEVAFTPSAGGERTAALRVPNDWVEGPAIVPLSGNGLAPADLAVNVAASQARLKGETRVTYAITVSNVGPYVATGVSFSDALPSQATYVSAVASQGTCTTPPVGMSRSISCTVGSLPSGSSMQIEIVVGVTTKKVMLSNTVAVTGTTFDPDLTNNTASVSTRVK